MSTEPKLAYTSSELNRLADDLDEMQEYLGKQVKRMDEVVDSIEAGWRGPTAKAYRALHRDAALEAVRIQQIMQLLALGVRLSEDGFTKQELETLDQFRRVQVDVDIKAAADTLSTPAAAGNPPAPRSRLDSL
ncbi:WXG100 family type VII secretion target [Streptomyces microflavus]|uniref:WXG100 family type VII secretion target n=1 Tax=Streptomyces TaxID=1883 RepID=UPI0029A202AF|nr:WXG100 family type VII secretion target [Streptomyces microflavus]MDX2403624.1 WXG100 family type VII secretion target [Streptomyces microflavus]